LKGYNDALRDCILAIGIGARVPGATSGLLHGSTVAITLAMGLDAPSAGANSGGDAPASAIASADAATRSLEDIMTADEDAAAVAMFGKSPAALAAGAARGRRRSSMNTGGGALTVATGTASDSGGAGAQSLLSPAAGRRSSNAPGPAASPSSSPVTERGGFSPVSPIPLRQPVGVVIKSRTLRIVTLPEDVDTSAAVAAVVARVQSLTHAEQDNKTLKVSV